LGEKRSDLGRPEMTTIVNVFPILSLCLIVFEVLVLSSLNTRTGWVKNRRIRRRVLLVCTSTLLIIQTGLAYDLYSYYQGRIGDSGSMGFPGYEENFDILPGESRQIGPLSNWFTVAALSVRLWSSPNEVTFYITDENIPQIKYEEGNYSGGELYLMLPYRFSRPFVIANWTINLCNPSQTEIIYVGIGVDSAIVSGVKVAEVAAAFPHLWPFIAALTLWFYTDLSLSLEKSRKPTGRVQASGQPQDGGRSTGQENPEQN